MPRLRTAVPFIALLVAGCSTAPPPSGSAPASVPPSISAAATGTPMPASRPPAPTPSAASPRELVAGSGALPAGTYTRAGFRPPLTLALEEGWFAGTLSDGFFDVQRDRGTPDVVAVQFARIEGVVGAGSSMLPATTAAAAVAAIDQNPGIVVIDESASRLGGHDGLNVVIDNQGAAHAPVIRVAPGTLGIDPGRRLWISLFDTPDGLLAVMVGGSVAEWERALTLAEPVLESVVVAAT